MNNILKNIKKYKFIFDNISRKNRKKLFFLSLFTLIAFFAEIIQLAFLRLFISLFENSEVTSSEISNLGLNKFFVNLSPMNVGILFIILLIICTLSRIIMLRYSLKTAAYVSSDIGNLTYRRIIKAPYFWQLKNSDSFSLGIITKDSENLMFLILSICNCFSHFFLIVFILTILITLNPTIAFSIVTPVFITYWILFILNNKNLKLQGKKYVDSAQGIINISLNSLGGIKNLIIDNSFNYFFHEYNRKVKENRFSNSNIQFIYQYPKILIEFIIILTLLSLIIFYFESLTKDKYIWSELITITFGLFRLISPLQIFYNSYSRLSEFRESLIRTEEFFKDLGRGNKENKFINQKKINSMLDKSKVIELKNVSFSYPNTDNLALKNINFVAHKGETIAIVGRSGSGKSTFMDMLMGLITPSDGRIYFNVNSEDNQFNILRKWQENISFVPQKVFLIEDTVNSNIAFGIPKNEINFDKVKSTSEQVKLKKIIDNFPHKFDQYLLRDKSELSGGEAQKLGIARGLYKDKKILFLDEISSSLDQFSENQIISLIQSLNKDTTKFIISHNINKINYVDRIIVFKDGSIDAIDTYDNLIKNNETFKQLKKESFLKK